MKAINLIGMKFGRLTVLSREGSSATSKLCGNVVVSAEVTR